MRAVVRTVPLSSGRYTLQQVAEHSGFSPRVIRKYITIGLLPRPAGSRRGPGAYYTNDHLRLLRYLRRDREQNVTLRDLVDRYGTGAP